MNYRSNQATSENVHNLRVAIKHLRAVVHLLKIIDPHGTKDLNKTLRNLGGSLSDARDQTVREIWLKKHRLPVGAHRSAAIPSLRGIEKKICTIESKVEALAEKRLAKADLTNRAIKISTDKIIRAEKRARKKGGDLQFHEWRKRIKDLLYQLEFLGIPENRPHLKKLGHQLGLAHDCAIVEQMIHSLPPLYQAKAKSLVGREKQSSQKRALRLAKHLRLRFH